MNSDYMDIGVAGGDTAQPAALRKRLKIIQRYLRPKHRRFLDCGCGSGEYVFQLVEQCGLDAYGIEYDIEKVRRGRLHSQHGHRIAKGDLQALELDSDGWDYAMLNEVLEHVPDERVALKEVHRILKPGGILFIFSPNRWFPFETHGVHLRRSGRRVPHWMPFIPYIPLSIGNRFFTYWARNYWHDEFRGLVTSAGFSIVETCYLWQTFEGISGRQPKLLTLTRPVLRRIANALESTHFLNRFGVSQVLVCQKECSSVHSAIQ
jgi:SAM-dependent methyltransferase